MKPAFGVNYKTKIREDICRNISKLDVVEIYTEKFFIKDDDPFVDEIRSQVPILLHGLDLSIGSSQPTSHEYAEQLKSVLQAVPHEMYSDHLSLTEECGTETGHLMPVAFSEDVAKRCIQKVQSVQRLSDKPFLLENIAYYYAIPGSSYSEDEFLSKICEESDCGILLDVNNLYINALNHGYDAIEFMDSIPLGRVKEIHLAGGSIKHGMHVDTHANPIPEPVWSIFREACVRTDPMAVIVERDANIPPFDETLAEVDRAREIWDAVRVRS